MQSRLLRSFSCFLTALFLLSALPATMQAAAAFPYPQNRTYPYGSKPIPFGASAAADATTILSKYNTWKSSHVVSAGAGMLRVQRDSADGNDTVSEGISYGMILAVYFNDQTTFDQLWAYKQSKNDGFGLMNWQISSGGGVIGANSAADADQDIAYSLYLANQQWGSGGTLNYKSLADAEMLKIIAYDLDTNRIKPGDSFNSCRYPSYFFPNEYRIFAKEKPADATTWSAVRTNCYNTQVAASNNSTGLVPEQCSDTGGAAGCTPSNPNSYYYNSARVPLRLAIDYVYYGDATAASELNLLNGFFGPINPSAVVDCYNLNGSTCGGYNSGAFVGPAGAGLMRTGGANLQTYYNALMADGTWPTRYFDGALAIWSLLLMSGNLPNIGDPSTIFTPTPSRTVTPYAGTPTFTATTTPIAFAYIFEDFENAILVNSYSYTGPAAGPTLTGGISSAQQFSGSYSDLIQVALPAAGNYGGQGFDSSYAPASGVMNFTGAASVRFYVRSDKAVSIRIAFREGNGVAGGDDEVWQSGFTAIPGTNTWTAVNIPIASFTENIYNTCNPNCLTTGNNVFNLASVKAAELSFNPIIAAPAANVYIDDIAFIPSVVPTMTPTKTPFANPFTLIYDDFENASSLAAGAPQKITTYANTALGASAAWALETVSPLVGLKSGRLDYNLGTAGTSYGAGGGFVSPYYTGTFTSPNAMAGRTIDATGAVSLTMWIKAAANLKFRLTFQEAGTLGSPVGSSDGESWYSALLTGTGSWQKLTVDISEFVEDPYNTLCNPTSISAPGPCITGGSAGNNTPNLNAIWQVGLKLPGEQMGVASRTGTVFLDDVAFITSFRTFTPSPSFTPGLASPTNTPSPSPSPSPTATRTVTPSATPSGTPTRSATTTATPSVSPSATQTRTVTPLASTPTFTATSSATGTVSASPSSTGTRTSTLSATPSVSSTASPSASPTGTPSRTATPSVTLTASPTQTSTRTSTVVLPTSTMTGTPLPGSTFTDTSTISPTSSVTPSISPTSTATGSATRTVTPSSTATATPSPTSSQTPSQTPLNTATPTSSITRSMTPSVTLTGSPSQSPTSSVTVVLPSATSTNTPLPGSTFTSTSTVSPVPTATPSITLSSSATPTLVSTFTLTSSVTVVLPSATSTNTPLPGSTFTSTSTVSPVATATASITLTVVLPSATSTNTPLPGSTFTSTSTASPIITATSSVTPLPSATPSATPTVTALAATPTRTVTLTASPSSTAIMPTATFTPVQTATNTPVLPANTWTADTTTGTGPILSTLPVPNPGATSIAVQLNNRVDRLILKIYTKSMMCIHTVESGGAGAGWVTLPLPTEFLNSAASGTYYYVVTAERNGGKSRAMGTGKMLILR